MAEVNLLMMFLVLGLRVTLAQIDFNNWKAPNLEVFKQPPMQMPAPFKRADAATYASPTPMRLTAPATTPSSTAFTPEYAGLTSAFPKVTTLSLPLPTANWPQWPSTVAGGTAPSSPGVPPTDTINNPQLSQQTPAPQVQQQPAEQPPSSSPPLPACSTTETSPEAVLRCVNAVRTNPRAFTSGYQCDWQSWISGVASPARAPLRLAAQLTQSAEGHAEWMARTQQFGHTGEGGSSVAQRIAATGWDQYPQAENIAVRYHSAYDVTMAWMCSEGHRTTLTHCQLDSVGTATAYDSNSDAYFVQDFGCSATNTCRCQAAT